MPPRPLTYSEPFHDKAPATIMFLESVLAMTVRAADPSQSFPVMAALASELQSRSYLSARRDVGNAAQPDKAISGWTPSDLTQAEQASISNAMGYARASELYPAIEGAFYSQLQNPLQQGTMKAADACKAAAVAINAILQGHPTPGPG